MNRQNQFNRDDLIRCGRGQLFDPESPRLPLPDMLMFDRITEVREDGGSHGRGVVRAELDIRPDLWFFGCHFMEDPVMPGCLGLDALWQLTGFFLGWSGHHGKGRALGVGEVKFTGQILPDHHTVTYTVDIKRLMTSKLVLAISDGHVAVDGKTIYEAKGMKVGVFTSTSDF